MYELKVQTEFSAAHRLRGYDGECEHLHGHNYRVELSLWCEELNSLGIAMDFREVKRIANNVIGRFDHKYLNEIEPFDKVNPTSEQIARHIADAVGGRLPSGVRVRGITCWESNNCAATYMPDGPPGAQGVERRDL